MDGWEIKAILQKIKTNCGGRNAYMYKVRWADSLVAANDFPDKSIIEEFEKGFFDYQVIGPDRKGKGGRLIDITNMEWIIECKTTGEKKSITYKNLKERFPDQLLNFYEQNIAPFM